MYTDILLPTDGSAGTTEAIEHALAIATAHDATIHVLYVVDRRHYMAAPADAKAEIRTSLESEATRAIEDAQEQIEAGGVSAVTQTDEGIPHRKIVEYAAENTDMVVMGTHGKTGREQVAALGSTTERVVENSDVPVLVVNLTAE